MTNQGADRVGLFVTCLVDLIRPSVGFAAAKLLEDAGCSVEVPAQACCGQPAFNSGDRTTARDIAMQVIAAFAPYDHVVAPSGSCAGMLRVHYPELFRGDPNWQPRADAFAAKTYELISFLVDVRGVSEVKARCDATATYHDSCSGLRELSVRDQPRRLAAVVELEAGGLVDRHRHRVGGGIGAPAGVQGECFGVKCGHGAAPVVLSFLGLCPGEPRCGPNPKQTLRRRAAQQQRSSNY